MPQIDSAKLTKLNNQASCALPWFKAFPAWRGEGRAERIKPPKYMSYNRDKNDRPFDLPTRQAVWCKGQIAPGYSSEVIRKDVCGKLMSWDAYGDISSTLGWEIDHIVPKAKGGGDELSNLQPLQWKNNRSKGDDYPNWSCAA